MSKYIDFMKYWGRLVGYFCLALSYAVGAQTAMPTPHQLSAETCSACHKDIYDLWKISLHANSTALKDPVHNALYRHIVGDPKMENLTLNGEYPVCLQCHAPNAAKDKKTKLDVKPYNEGVNCLVCHTIKSLKEDDKKLFGLEAYVISPTHLQAPSGRYLSPEASAFHPFPMEPNQGMLRTSQVCLGCHANFHDVVGEKPLETVTCQSCHMPKSAESTYHAFLGAHSESMLKRMVVVTLTIAPQGDELQAKVKLKNVMPHPFPGSSPFRSAYLKIAAYDKEDKLVWSNFKTFPPEDKDNPEAVFKFLVQDSAGKPQPLLATPTLPENVRYDNRIKPFETRELEYKIPAQAVLIVRAEVVYRLLSDETLSYLPANLLTGDLTNPVVVGIAEVRL